MNYSLQTLSSTTVDSTPALHISVNTEKYQFDAPEGAQRTIVQGKARMRNLNTIFLTSLRPEDVGGLSGMIFTLADRGTKKLTIVGPENTGAFLATFRHFLTRGDIHLDVIERSMVPEFNESKPIFENEAVQVWAVAAVPAEAAAVEGEDPSAADELMADEEVTKDAAEDESATSSEKKRKRSPSPPKAASFELVTPAQTLATDGHPYRRLTAAHSATSTRALLSTMFGPVNITAIRSADLPVVSAAARSSYGQHDVMPLLARPANDVFLSYVVLGPEKRGKVDMKLVDALSLPKMLLRDITLGKSVTFTSPTSGDEVMVKPEQVLGPATKATATIVVHCPGPEYIDSLVETPLWKRWYGAEDDPVRPVHVMWHKAGVWQDERYRAWMAKFGKDVVHLSGDPALANNHLNMVSSAISTASLSLLDPAIYKRFQCGIQPVHKPTADNVYPLLPLQKVDIMPGARKAPILDGMLYSGGFPNAHLEGVENLTQLGEADLWKRFDKTMPVFATEVRKAQAKVVEAAKTRREKQPGDDVVVTTLGTGSSMPSKYRNVSATHIHVPGHGGILLDAGEGTLGQLSRLHGPEGVIDVLKNLKVIFISHLHADHHSGLTNVLRLRTKHTTPDNEIMLLGSNRLLTQMREVADYADLGLDRLRFLDNWDVLSKVMETRRMAPNVRGNVAWVENATGLTQLNTVQVDHRGHACFGSIMGHRDGWKIVYSGDTKPCGSLVNAGKDATLLIHEATLADDTPSTLRTLEREREAVRLSGSRRPMPKSCIELARDKGHSTFSQAVDIGRRMRSKHTLLTHFSQRYPKNPVSTFSPLSPFVSDEERAFADSQVIALASDFVSVAIGDMWKMPLHRDAVAALYEAQGDDESDTESVSSRDRKSNPKVNNGGGKSERKAAKTSAATAASTDVTKKPKGGQPANGVAGEREPTSKKVKRNERNRSSSPRSKPRQSGARAEAATVDTKKAGVARAAARGSG